MGRKCGVEGCLSDSSRPEDTGVTFHKVPMHSDIRPKWMSLCKIPDDKKSQKVIYICSRHFLRMDFCNFKGKKYMLRQGVLPSVFPWDKSKLEAIKGTLKSDPNSKLLVKQEVMSEEESLDEKPNDSVELKQEEVDIKPEVIEDIKQEESLVQEQKPEVRPGSMNFGINSRIEALDNNNVWYPARVVEEDYEENEVLVHFETSSNKIDEWICKDSPRLRPFQEAGALTANTASAKSGSNKEQYVVGERCLASWSDARKFPATVTKVLATDTYEVLFDDGFVKNLKAHRMCKAEGRPMQSSPLFDPIRSTKQERRDKKRKINIAQLFGKRPRLESTEERPPQPKTQIHREPQNQTPDVIYEPWVPVWENGKPVGIESSIETIDGARKSVIVPDPRLPEGWQKHLVQRVHGACAGKWDTLILSPDNRRFRTKNDIKAYLEETKLMKYNWTMFDFSILKTRSFKQKKRDLETDVNRHQSEIIEPNMEPIEQEEIMEATPEEEENKNLLKIPVVDDSYQCPIEGCGKIFRRENLAQMHVKHYHPEYTKFLDSTPNVADLAYARTVGESLDKSPSHKTPSNKPSSRVSTTPKASTTKLPQSPQTELDINPESPLPTSAKTKDSEIIKLLNTKPFDIKKEEPIKPLPSGLPSNMYPDIKLKDLLNKSEGIPHRDDLNLRALSTTRPPAGIKTLLPVVRPENRQESHFDPSNQSRNKSGVRRKRALVETIDSSKGGQVIKIVRMKQEEIINCTCGYTEEDGLMIQCDLCLCWQHAFCNNIERESQVPEKYVCYICQNPAKQRMSKKYFHDQDWLKHGVLASTNFHTRDEEALTKRFEKLKKSHDVSGGLFEIKDFIHGLKVKLKIAEAKNHPKLYLWSKPWEKLPLPEKTTEEDIQPNLDKADESKSDQNESMLMMILKGVKEGVKNDVALQAPIIPQPEAAIDSADCRLNLLEHIGHAQNLIDERLNDFEKQINDLEDVLGFEDDENYPKTRQTISMLLKDLNTLQELSTLTTL